MWLAMLAPELLTAIAVVVLLFGVPVFVVAVLAVVSGVLQHDIERQIAERTDGEAVDLEDGVDDLSSDRLEENR